LTHSPAGASGSANIRPPFRRIDIDRYAPSVPVARQGGRSDDDHPADVRILTVVLEGEDYLEQSADRLRD
jgi:hypothetical protein